MLNRDHVKSVDDPAIPRSSMNIGSRRNTGNSEFTLKESKVSKVSICAVSDF